MKSSPSQPVDPHAADIAIKLNVAERAVDTAMIQSAEFLQAMLKGRRKMNLAASVGQREIDLAVAGLAGLSAVRGHMVEAHSGLSDVADHLAVGWRLDGSWEQKIEPEKEKTRASALAA